MLIPEALHASGFGFIETVSMRHQRFTYVRPSRPREFHPEHRVTGGGRPPPVPTERSVQIYRTTLFGR